MTYHQWSWFLMLNIVIHSQRSPTITNSKWYCCNGIPRITKYKQWFPDIASSAPYILFWLGHSERLFQVGKYNFVIKRIRTSRVYSFFLQNNYIFSADSKYFLYFIECGGIHKTLCLPPIRKGDANSNVNVRSI